MCVCNFNTAFYVLRFPSGWTTSSAEAVHQLRPNAQPRHNQRLGKSISSFYELERMHNLHTIQS